MLTKIIIPLGIILGVFLVVVALQPSEFLVVRSTTVAAEPVTVFNQVINLHQWQNWSPWENMDPKMKRSYGGPAAGTGAMYDWDGNRDVGAGRMIITESRPAELIRMTLEFYRPMAGVCTVEFSFKPEGKQTVVTWSMAGTNNFMAKAVCLFLSMDKMLGSQFEQGLGALKRVSEKEAGG